MQKFLRTLMLMAVMLLPFVSQGQTCTPISTFPITYGFETSEGFPAGVSTAPTTNTLGSCWRNLSIDSVGTTGGRKWHISTSHYTGSQALRLPDKNNGNRTLLVFPAMNFTSPNGYVVSFWINRVSSAKILEGFEVWVSDTDTLGPNADSLGHYSRKFDAPYPVAETAAGWYQYETPVINRTGTVYLILLGISEYGNYTDVDDIVIEEHLPCDKVTDLAVSAATSNSLTLTWSDALNTGATYNVYDMSDNSLVYAGVTGTTYTVTGLDANTAYTFGVKANCGTDGLSGIRTIEGRTTCAALNSLPVTWTFETDELQGTTSLLSLPWCFERYNNSTSTSYNYYPYAYNSSSYAYGGSSRSMYFYGSASYGADTMALIFPELNVTTYPMNGNRVKFFARGSSTSYTKNLYIGTMSDPTDISTFTLADTVAITGTTYAQYSISLDNAPATDAYVVMIAFKGNGAIYVDDVTLEVKPACMDVAGVTVSATTSSSVTLTWTDAQNPAGTTYTIYDMSDTTAVLTNVPSTTGTITGLTANTPYTFGVQANCTAGDAPIYSIDARTACGAINSLPYTMGFEVDEIRATSPSLDAMPWCWTRINNTVGTSYNYYPYSYGSYPHTGSRSFYFYAYDASWFTGGDTTGFIMPELNVTTYPMNTTRVSFWAKVASTTDFVVHVGTMSDPDDLSTFTEVDSVVVTGTDYAKYTVSLANATATDGYVAFIVPRVYSSMYMDDLTLEEIPNCLEVNGVSLVSMTETSANIIWNSTGATGGYQVQVRKGGEILSTVGIVITDTTAVLSNLELDSTYQVYVRSVCGANYSEWSDVLNVHIGYCLPNPTSVDGSGITSVSFGGMTNTTNHAGSTAAFVNNSAMSGSVAAGTTATVSITYATGSSTVYSYGTIIWVDWDNSLTFEDDEIVYTGTSAQGSGGVPQVLDATFDIPATQAIGSYRMRIVGADSYFDSYISGTATGNHSPCFTATYAVAEDYTLIVTAAPSCLAPTALAASNITDNSATLTWTGDATGYTVVAADGTTTPVTTTTYALTGLTAQTTYTFGVFSNCGADHSDTVYVTFTTACGAVAIPFTETFETTSTTIACWSTEDVESGTGLYNGAFRFFYNTNPPQYLISPELSGTTDGVKVSFLYKIQSTSYPESFTLGYSTTTSDTSAFTWGTDQNNLTNTTYQLYSEILPAGVKYVSVRYNSNDMFYLYIDSMVFEMPPACLPVTGLAVTNLTDSTATLTWTGDAAGYTVVAADGTATPVTTTTYALTGLTANTTYTYGVVSNCGTDHSDTVYVTFHTPCVTFTTLPFVESFDVTSPTLGCWMAIDADGDGHGWSLYNGGGSIASASYYNPTYTALTPDNWLIAPKIALPAGGNYEVAYSARPQDTNYPAEHYGLYISTTTTDTSAFTLLQQWTLTAVDTPAAVLVDLSTYAGQSIYLALRHWNCTDEFMIIIDDFTVREQPTANQVVINVNSSNAYYGNVSGGGVYTIGDSVTVTATPNTGYVFVNWTDSLGTAVSTANPYTFIAATNMTLTANFSDEPVAPDTLTVTLTVNNSTMGTTNPVPGTYQVVDGDSLAVTATANTGYYFQGWALAANYMGSTLTDTIPATEPTYVIYAEDYLEYVDALRVEALFGTAAPVLDSMLVNVAVNNPTMGTTIPAPGAHYFYEGDTCSVVAVANAGYHLTGWTIQLAYTGYGTYADTTLNFAVPDVFDLLGGWVVEDGDHNYTISVMANFAVGDAPVMHDSLIFHTSVNDATMGTISPAPGTHYYVDGDQVIINVTPNTGYYVSSVHYAMSHAMYGNVIDTVFSDSADIADFLEPDTIYVDEDYYGVEFTLDITFAPVGATMYNVTLVSNNVSMGTVSPNGTTSVAEGSTFTATATAEADHHFVAWLNGTGDTISTSAIYTFTVTADVTLMGVFAANAGVTYYTVTVSYDQSRGRVEGAGPYEEGSSVSLVAYPFEGYEFEAWLDEAGDTLSTNTAYAISNLQSNRTLTALFRVKVGIDDVDADNVIVTSIADQIVVRGAEGRQVVLFDVNGRMMSREMKAAENVTFRVSNSGVYLVKVGDAAAKRVVVIR